MHECAGEAPALGHVAEQALATAQAAGIPVLCFTVNDRQDAEALLARGVTAVFSDRIDSLRGL